MIGGAAGFAGHISICDDVVVLGTSFITHSIDKPGVYSSALPSEEAGVVAPDRGAHQAPRLDGQAAARCRETRGLQCGGQGFFRGLTK